MGIGEGEVLGWYRKQATISSRVCRKIRIRSYDPLQLEKQSTQDTTHSGEIEIDHIFLKCENKWLTFQFDSSEWYFGTLWWFAQSFAHWYFPRNLWQDKR